MRAALLEGGKLQVDEVVLPDGEEYKSMEVLGKVRGGVQKREERL